MIDFGWISTSRPQRYVSLSSVCRALRDSTRNFTKADLAVHKRKVEDVRRWLLEAFEGGPSGKLKRYRVCSPCVIHISKISSVLQRILALTGPAGAGKTATIRVLAQEIGFHILEWRNSFDDRFGDSGIYNTFLHTMTLLLNSGLERFRRGRVDAEIPCIPQTRLCV
jgi:hypothetical protein